jgi:hypothetical protein
MKKFVFTLIVAFFYVGMNLIPVYATEKNEDLWQKAVQIAAQNQNYAPGKGHMLVRELNTQGKIKKEEETWLEMTVGQDNQYRVECVKAMENGKDVTEKERNNFNNNADKIKSQKSSKRSFSFGNDDLNPFDPKVQKDVFYHPTDRKETMDGQECVLYEYTWKKDVEKTQKGTAWLVSDTGMPLFLKFTLEPNPKYVKSFEATAHFNHKDGVWYPEIGDMESSGGFWFKRFHIQVHFTLSDYWLYQHEEKNEKP